MRKSIIRTITATTINSAKVTFKRGVPELTQNAPITINGTIEEDKALKEVRKVYGETAQVVSMDEVSNVYEISVEDFIKYAHVVKTPTPEQQQEATEVAEQQ